MGSQEENLAALTTSASLLATGNVLGAILVPVSLQLDRIFGGGPRELTLPLAVRPLEMAFRSAIRAIGLDKVLVEAWFAQEKIWNPKLRDDAFTRRKQGVRITADFLHEAPIELIKQVIALAETGQILQDPTAIAVDLQAGQLPEILPLLPTEGTMVDELDAKFMPGLNRELNGDVSPPALKTGVQAIIDLARWLVPEEIIGEGVQFKDEITVGPSVVTLLRIPAKKGKIIGIYNTNVLVNTGSSINARNFTLIAGTVLPGAAGDTSGVYIRQHGAMRVRGNVGVSQNPTREMHRSFGSYVVRSGQDYVIGINSEVAAAQYFESVQVMGYYFDEGMWPIGK